MVTNPLKDNLKAKRRRSSGNPSGPCSTSEPDESDNSTPPVPSPPTTKPLESLARENYSIGDLEGYEDLSDDELDDEARLSSLPESSAGPSRLSIRPRTESSSSQLRPSRVSERAEEATPGLKIPYSERPSISDFTSLGIVPSIVSSLASMSIKRPTPVQAACIPALLEGNDCIGNAKTGQGKTIAFSLPILQMLAKDSVGIFALILTPTRELAFQIAEQLTAIGGPLNIRTAVVVGGMDMTSQMITLGTRPHIVVATPGRLVDLLNESNGQGWDLSRLKFLVLDEADRMLGTAFATELAAIFAKVPEQRQTCLFTATLTPTIEALALAPPRPGKRKPYIYRDSSTSDIETVETLKQQYILCPSHVREVYLYHLLCNPPESILHLRRNNEQGKTARRLKKRDIEAATARRGGRKRPKVKDSDFDVTPPPPTIIFTQTAETCAYLSTMLRELGFGCAALHSKMPREQKERLASLQLFRSFQVPILVCTDIGARGLDMDGVGMVVNWDLPRNPKEGSKILESGEAFQTAEETYVHRVGRTARMGRGGFAVSFVTERKWDEETVKRIETKINVQLSEYKMNEDAVLEKLNLVSAAKRLATMEMERSGFGKREERHKAIKARRKATAS